MQNRLTIFISTLVILLLSYACKKDSVQIPNPGPTAITIVNAISTSQPLIPVFDTSGPILYFATAQTVGYTGSFVYSPPGGPNTLYIVQKSGPDTVVNGHEPTLFSGTFDLTASDIYSLFLAGDTTKVDTLLIQDQLPPYYSDSSAGARFVNLSPNSQPILVTNKADTTHTPLTPNLAYKTITGFSKYPAQKGASFTFEIRNAANDSVMLTYPWSYTLFKNQTLVISGFEDSTGTKALKVFSVNNF